LNIRAIATKSRAAPRSCVDGVTIGGCSCPSACALVGWTVGGTRGRGAGGWHG
jgi:hypothetical protein